MSREILFRGKIKGSNRWVEGLPVYGNCKEISSICTSYSSATWLIVPETVGQFTGLTDKNGVRIFEGAICKLSSSIFKAIIVFCNGSYCLQWIPMYENEKPRPLSEKANSDTYLYEDLFVIGNIHDEVKE